jgi:lipopolysaccharide biosynthesis glycosyltransferase
VPRLAGGGWALFLDADMLIRANLAELFDCVDERYAVMCVKHQHNPAQQVKMDNQPQVAYRRKNWSSFMLFNCDHPSNRRLTVELVNTAPGRDLHGFCWLEDHEIGELDLSWNWLVGYSDENIDPRVVHFTVGGPWLPAFRHVAYADEWHDELRTWAA